MAFRARMRSNVNVSRVITLITATTIGLWIGSDIITTVAVAMNQTTNIFSSGFELIGFDVTAGVMQGTVSTTGILSVVGLAAFAVIVLEFVQFKF